MSLIPSSAAICLLNTPQLDRVAILLPEGHAAAAGDRATSGQVVSTTEFGF
jgi:hypothetical protein